MRFFTAGRQPQLSLEELCHVKWLLGGLLALLSVWTLFHLEASVWPFATIATITIAGTMLHPGLPARVPRLVWSLSVPAIAIAFVLDAMSNELVLSLVRLNTMLVMYRAVTYRERRDDLQLIALSLFLVVLTGVLTVSIVFVVQILAFTGVGMMLLFVINVLDDALAGAPMRTTNWVRIPRRRLFLRLWQACDARLAVLALSLFVAVVLASALIFMAIPRFEVSNPISFFSFNKGGSLTGFSEEIALGEVTDLKNDDGVAMRVDIRDGAVVPASPYWRMVALDEYDHGAFRVSRSVRDAVGDRSLPYLDLASPHGATPREGRVVDNGRVVVFLEPGVSRHLPQPGGFTEIHFKETQEIVSNDLFQVYATRLHSAVLLSYQIEGADFSGVVHDPLFGRERAQVPSGSGRRAAPRAGALSMAAAKPREGTAYPQTTLELPVSATARDYLAGVVREITGGRSLPAAEFAARASAYLQQHHSYSMQIRLPDQPPGEREDPVIRWMRSGQGGHCEFFAAAFTLLGRAAGHPVRVVTGFKGGTWNGFEGYFMVRHSDAHAWCEIFDGANAWLRADPTPGSAAVAGLDSAPETENAVARIADRSTAAYLDSLRMLWYRRIVNFDQRSQRGVAETLKDIAHTAAVWGRATMDVLRQQYAAWEAAPLSFSSKGDILYFSLVLFGIAVLMKRLGIGKGDVMEWFSRGPAPTRQRAGQLLRRLEHRLGRPPRRRSWNEAEALRLADQLTTIRYARTDSWPEPRRTFRAVRRIL